MSLPALTILKLKRQHSHADEVAAVDPLKTLRNDRSHAEKRGSLRCPIARAPHPIIFARKENERHVLLFVLFAGLEDGKDFSIRHAGKTTFFSGHFVEDPDVAKSAAHHHLVIAPSASVAIEIFFLNALREKVFSRRRDCFERARG